MLAATFIFIGIILLVLIHELGHFLAAKQAGIRVEEFGFGFPPRIKAWRRGETEYSLNWLPFGGFVRIYGENKQRLIDRSAATGEVIAESRSFVHQSAWRRFVVIAAGISINLVAGWLLLSTALMIGARERVSITEVQPGSPAAEAQLMLGDSLTDFSSADDFVAFTHAHQGGRVVLVVERDGAVLRVPITLRHLTASEAPLGAAVSKTGFAPLPFFSALKQGMIDTVQTTAEIFRSCGRLIGDLFGHARIPDTIVGPIGIFSVAGELGRLGFVYLLQLIGMISLNLAALNAIPFPALDGGRILFLLIEKIKGSPLPMRGELWANIASFGFLIVLMVLITGRDIVRLF